MKFKRTIKFVASMLLLVGISFGSVLASTGVLNINALINEAHGLFINGRQIVYKEPDGTILRPIMYNNRVYVPIRAIASGLEYPVEWGNGSYAFLQEPKYFNVDGAGEIMLYEFYDALTVTYGNSEPGLYVNLDKTKLTPQIKEFEYISITTNTIENVAEELSQQLKGQSLPTMYTKEEFTNTTRYQKTWPVHVFLYDKNKKPIGYSAITKSDPNTKCIQAPKDYVTKVVNGVSIDVLENSVKIDVDVGKLPDKISNFKYIAFANTRSEITDELVFELIEKYILAGRLAAFSDIRDRSKLPTRIENLPCILAFLDKDKTIIGYSILE